MKEKTKLALGILAGAAAGIAVGVAISDSETAKTIKDTLAEASDQMSLKLQGLLEDGKDYLGDLKTKVAQSELGSEVIEHTEG